MSLQLLTLSLIPLSQAFSSYLAVNPSLKLLAPLPDVSPSFPSAQLDLDDVTTVGSRTPYNTPPERRRENVFELGEVLEVLQSVGRRNSEVLRANG